VGEGRSRLILLSVAVAESSWLFALFAVGGIFFGFGGSPLPWLSLFGLLSLSIAVGYVLGGAYGIEGNEASIAIWQSIAGLVVIYLLLGTGTFLGGTSIDIGWIVRVVSGDLSANATASAIFGFFIAIWLWRHGIHLGTARYPEDHLSRVFKIGIAVLAVAVLVDQSRPEYIGAGILMMPFFAATLLGLAIGRLPEQGVGGRTGHWARVIAVSVFGVMGVGMFIGLLGSLYGRGGVRVLFAGWGLVVDGFIWLITYPVTWATAVLMWLLNLFGNKGTGQQNEPEKIPSGQEILGIDPDQTVGAGNATIDSIVHMLRYPMVALIVIAAFFILAMAFRRLSNREDGDDGDERESIRGEVDTSGDMSRLLGGLVPGWLRRRSGTGWKYPADPALAAVFSLYFDAIAIGVKWGMVFQPTMTPVERLPHLEWALPGAPFKEVTERFNAACYGGVAADATTVANLRQELAIAEEKFRKR
jgi:hypothetical protein